MKRRNGIHFFLVLFFGLIIIFSGWNLYSIYSEYSKGAAAYQDLAERYTATQAGKIAEKRNGVETSSAHGNARDFITLQNNRQEEVSTEIITVDFDALKVECEDVVGWLYCPGTKVNYPVVQSEDNDYYLHRLLNGEYSLGGTLFLDYRNADDFSDWNSIVYGHNMKDGSMFATLPEYMEQDFYEAHSVWYLLTEAQNYEIDLVGGYVTPADSDTYAFPQDYEGTLALFDQASRKSTFDPIENLEAVGTDERLITLSTCVYDYENARYVLVGVLRRLDEKLIQ